MVEMPVCTHAKAEDMRATCVVYRMSETLRVVTCNSGTQIWSNCAGDMDGCGTDRALKNDGVSS